MLERIATLANFIYLGFFSQNTRISIERAFGKLAGNKF